MSLQPGQCRKLSHRKWRSLLRKQKRKLARQDHAKLVQSLELPGDTDDDGSDVRQGIQEESLRLLAHEQWLERERLAQEEFAERKRSVDAEKRKKEEEELRIKLEWEERERREKEEQDLRAKLEEKKKKRQEELLKEATANENKGDGPWHNPLAPVKLPGVERQVAVCPFFVKTAACRFGERCSRLHPVPDSSSTLVFPNMYNHLSLDQSLRDEFDADVNLEYEESETYKHFDEFYQDVLPEFKTAGTIVQFKVCRNFEPHLKGNVYVQYSSEEQALRAYALFNARWYGGRQIAGRFVDITSWRAAICGQYHRKKCPKGRSCNFLHVFVNPNNEFRDADHDYGDWTQSIRLHGDSARFPDRRRHGDSERRRRRRDGNERLDVGSERQHRHDNRSKNGHSPTTSRSRDRARSRDGARSRSRDTARSRSRSRDRARSRSRSRDRARSRSRSRDRARARSRDRALSQSSDRVQSQSRGGSKLRDRYQSLGGSRTRELDDRKRRSRSREKSKSRDHSKSRHKKSKKSHKRLSRSIERHVTRESSVATTASPQ